MLKTTTTYSDASQYSRNFNNTTPTPTLDSDASNQSQSPSDTPLALTTNTNSKKFAYSTNMARNYYGAVQQQQQHLMENYENYNPLQYVQQQHFNNYQNILNGRLGQRLSSSSNDTSTSSASLTPSPPQQRYSLMNTNIHNKDDHLTTQLDTSSIDLYDRTNESQSLPLKKRRAVPVESKDLHYWEKRRKNNESAKRSRDIKREKESRVYMRNSFLEQENLQLKTQVALYEAEIDKLRHLAYGHSH